MRLHLTIIEGSTKTNVPAKMIDSITVKDTNTKKAILKLKKRVDEKYGI